MAHHQIRPVQRDCICPTRPAQIHTQRCDSAFREKFFGAWATARETFYGRSQDDDDRLYGEAS